MTPGTHPNGLFWTTEIPPNSFRVWNNDKQARLRLRSQPLVDSIAFGEPIGLSSTVDINVSWRASAPAVSRGFGNSVDPTDPGAFEGLLADASAVGSARAKRVGFSFKSTSLSASGFFAEIGRESNGSFLS